MFSWKIIFILDFTLLMEVRAVGATFRGGKAFMGTVIICPVRPCSQLTSVTHLKYFNLFQLGVLNFLYVINYELQLEKLHIL